jgi:hypothetical protein
MGHQRLAPGRVHPRRRRAYESCNGASYGRHAGPCRSADGETEIAAPLKQADRAMDTAKRLRKQAQLAYRSVRLSP